MKTREYLDYYKKNKIIPAVSLNEIKPNTLKEQRFSFFFKIGVVADNFTNKEVLELCPGTGVNSLYLLKFTKIKHITLVDNNPSSIKELRRNLKNFDNNHISFILNESNNNVFYNYFYIYKKEKDIKKFQNKYKYLEKYNRIIVNFIKYDSKVTNNIKLFSAHYRFEAVKTLVDKKYYTKILYLDIDSLINKSIYKICTEINYTERDVPKNSKKV